MSPTKRTIALLESLGYLAAVTERRQGPISIDLYGSYDCIGIRRDRDVLLVQCTSTPNFSSRLKKCVANPLTRLLVDCGIRCEVWGWDHRPDPRVANLADFVVPIQDAQDSK